MPNQPNLHFTSDPTSPSTIRLTPELDLRSSVDSRGENPNVPVILQNVIGLPARLGQRNDTQIHRKPSNSSIGHRMAKA